MENFINELKFDDKGLIPAVVQDENTKEVLMVAYMTAETLKMTLETKKATFFSRSRGEIWIKGETSGNYMNVSEVRVDCDGDCLVVLARPDGPACHTGNRSCFYRVIDGNALIDDKSGGSGDALMREFATIAGRKAHPEEGSYTNYLFDKGEDKILKKVGEEAAEVVIAGKNRDKAEIRYETADLLYHIAVMLADNDMSWNDIFEEIDKRA
ncbi:MAG: bifunctional phosphoribosyl-AMP cyclohydrolase/phosphoribosyl-ATP diphosphatase HisIE [Clostridia bacterium]|nr:bifunctional phosphoribosyl-AMP cyclohydrolase/phosphoribosyl-ATP diphosphatase HisIE [Clostridia bacterium]